MKPHNPKVVIGALAFGCTVLYLAVIQPQNNDSQNQADAIVKSIPSYDVDRVCKENDDGSHDYDFTGDCIRQEQYSFDELKSVWAQTPEPIRSACLHEDHRTEWKYYSGLKICRDRALKAEYDREHPPYVAPVPKFQR